MHLDKEWYAVHAHHKHLCEACNQVTDHGRDSVSNPLALFKLTVVEGKLRLDWPDDSGSEATGQSTSISLGMGKGKEPERLLTPPQLVPLVGKLTRSPPLLAAPLATVYQEPPASVDSLVAPRNPAVESDANGVSAASPTVADLARQLSELRVQMERERQDTTNRL